MGKIFAATILLIPLLANPAAGQQASILNSPDARMSTKSSAAAWEEKWANIVAAGKKEGKVSLYTAWAPPVRTALIAAFRQKFGIELECTPVGRGDELEAKVSKEHSAGLYYVDVMSMGKEPLALSLGRRGLVGSIEPLLILPEIREPKYWLGGTFPFVDKDKRVITMIASRQGYIVYNTDLIKKGEITTYKDALNPQYKGKITLDDPSLSGNGNVLLTHLALDFWNLNETKDYLRRIIKEQGGIIQRDRRMLVETVARGKYAIGLAPNPQVLSQMMTAGASLGTVKGPIITGGSGNIAIPTRFAHPNAAAVFVNWLLSKEGQRVFAVSYGSPSLRNDVSTEGINQIFLVQPDEKVVFQNLEHLVAYPKMGKIFKQVIREAAN